MTLQLDDLRTGLWPDRVTIMDVGPRDGLQNESFTLSTGQKLELINALLDAGLTHIEAGSFVHPKLVPQMADTGALFPQLPRREGVRFDALIPNARGFDLALAAKARRMALVLSATEGMNRKNLNMSIAESMEIAKTLTDRARVEGVGMRVYISVAFVCPFEGQVNPARTIEITDALFAMGVEEVCIADTIGRGSPQQVARMFAQLGKKHDRERLAAHFHNTYDLALANTIAALQQGITLYDASIGGLGGCPFAPGATGNTATEDLVYMLHNLGVETGLNLERLTAITDWIREVSGKVPPSAVYRATKKPGQAPTAS